MMKSIYRNSINFVNNLLADFGIYFTVTKYNRLNNLLTFVLFYVLSLTYFNFLLFAILFSILNFFLDLNFVPHYKGPAT